MKRKLVASAFSLLAASAGALAQNTSALSQDSAIPRMAEQIETRSLATCNPDYDAREQSQHRRTAIESAARSSEGSDSIQSVINLAMANSGGMSVCFDSRLHGSPHTAVLYMGAARIISVNPDVGPDKMPAILGQSFALVRNRFNQFNAGRLSETELAAPAPLTEAAPPPPTSAPHRLPEYRAAL